MKDKIKNDIARAIKWAATTLQLIGIWWVVMFIKLNVYGDPVTLNIPNTPIFLSTVVNEELQEYIEATKPTTVTTTRDNRK